MKAAITLMSENMTDIGDAMLHDYVSNLVSCNEFYCFETYFTFARGLTLWIFMMNVIQLSTLLAVPDHPKEPPVYLLRGLMSFELNSPQLSLKCLALLSAYAQEKYPYSFDSGKLI